MANRESIRTIKILPTKPLSQCTNHGALNTSRFSPIPLKIESKGLQWPENILAGPHYFVFANSKLPKTGS